MSGMHGGDLSKSLPNDNHKLAVAILSSVFDGMATKGIRLQITDSYQVTSLLAHKRWKAAASRWEMKDVINRFIYY